MQLLQRILNHRRQNATKSSSSFATVTVEEAIAKASRGQMPVEELLDVLVHANVYVPMESEPRISSSGAVEAWSPATVTKAQSSSTFVTIFTSKAATDAFIAKAVQYTYVFQTSTEYLLSLLQTDQGVVVNVGTDAGFEWSAQGISDYIANAKRRSTR